MRSLILLLILFSFFQRAEAYKVYSYDSNGNRVYKTIEPKDFAKYKNAPKRSYIREPRKSWEITNYMRARKRTSSDFTHRK